jgi:DeoR-like helix-turn-helix domain/DeoR C terminal sensor domain
VRNQSIPIPRPVLSEERRRHILEILNRDGRVLVGDLATQFRTSQVTIRKDLDALQAHGRIYRSHGGALPARESALEDPSLREEEKLHRKEKMHVAAAAANMVRDGQVVILASGTTTTAIASALRWDWVNIDKDKMLSRGEYLGIFTTSVLIGPSLTQSVKTDKCTTLSTHVIGMGLWSYAVSRAATVTLWTMYHKDFGVVHGARARIRMEFDKYLLLEAR